MTRWIFPTRSTAQSPLLLCLLLSLLLSACASHDLRPDLPRLYQSARQGVKHPPVIVIPGVMGSRLANAQGEEQWIGSLSDALFSDYQHLALPIDADRLEPADDGLQVTGLTDVFAGRDFYQSILQILEEAGGYVRAEPGQTLPDAARHYYVFSYDWRQDNVRSAKRLSQLIEQIRCDHQDPDLQVDIVAHSMGGLVTRYYLRYGETDVLNDNEFPINYHGADRVRRVVLLGTPNLGSANSLHTFIEGRKVGLRRINSEVLASFPSLYQLFPHPLNDWIMTTRGTPLKRDLFDVNIWRRFEWSIFHPEVRQRMVKTWREQGLDEEQIQRELKQFEAYFERHLERARRFVWSLTVRMEREPWQLVVYGGDCTLTPNRVVVEEVRGESVLRLWPDDILHPVAGVDYEQLMMQPGDGAVTKASLLARDVLDPLVPRHEYSHFPLHYPIFLCEGHDALTSNVFFQDNLLHFLLSQDTSRP